MSIIRSSHWLIQSKNLAATFVAKKRFPQPSPCWLRSCSLNIHPRQAPDLTLSPCWKKLIKRSANPALEYWTPPFSTCRIYFLLPCPPSVDARAPRFIGLQAAEAGTFVLLQTEQSLVLSMYSHKYQKKRKQPYSATISRTRRRHTTEGIK